MLQVKKRNGSMQNWDPTKIQRAITLAASRSKENVDVELLLSYAESHASLDDVLHNGITVDQIHKIVENLLMRNGYLDTAREYITYRFSHMPDLFRKRNSYRPYEYPQFIEYIDAIHQSFWTHKSFNLDSSVQDIKVNMPKHHSQSVIRSILSIASVEAKVKSFWSKLGDRLPKAEFEELGATIGSNEVYHAHFYAKVLDSLGLDSKFEEVLHMPAMKARINYMNKALAGKEGSNKEYLKSLFFFSLFVENTSLFSQFLTISVFNKELNQVSGLAQGISATAIEETLHSMVGADIINIARKEHPEWFDAEFELEVYELTKECLDAEIAIIDWIFEEGELEFLPKHTVVEYIKSRMNKGLEMCQFKPILEVDTSVISSVEWFDVQTKTTIHRDFFAGHSVNYNKNSISFSEDDLF